MSLKFTHNSFSLSFTHAHARGAVLTIFLLFFTLQIGAQGFTSTSAYRAERKAITTQSAQVDEYQYHKSTIYEPFAGDAPGSSSDNGARKISSRQNSWGGGGMGDNENDDAGYRDPGSPIGEPWIMLFFAAAAAATVTWRKRKVT